MNTSSACISSVAWICLLLRIATSHTDRILQIRNTRLRTPDVSRTTPDTVSASPVRQASPPRFLRHHQDMSHRYAHLADLHVQAVHFHPYSAPDSSRHAFHTAYIARFIVSLHQIPPTACRTGTCHLRRSGHISGLSVSGMKYIVQKPADITGAIQPIVTLISGLVKIICFCLSCSIFRPSL